MENIINSNSVSFPDIVKSEKLDLKYYLKCYDGKCWYEDKNKTENLCQRESRLGAVQCITQMIYDTTLNIKLIEQQNKK